MEKLQSRNNAIQLVTTALQSSSIKLRGPTGAQNTESAEIMAAADAAYLSRLLSDLTTALQRLGE